jgi:hypothetical protein
VCKNLILVLLEFCKHVILHLRFLRFFKFDILYLQEITFHINLSNKDLYEMIFEKQLQYIASQLRISKEKR